MGSRMSRTAGIGTRAAKLDSDLRCFSLPEAHNEAMRRSPASLVVLGLVAGAARGQDCVWNLVTSLGPPARQDAGIAYDSVRGRVVLFGGGTFSTTLGDTWEWNGTAWTQVSSTGPSARRGHVMAFHEGWGRTVLFGSSGPHFNT